MILHQSLTARAAIIISLVTASLPPSLASGTEPAPLTTAAAVARSNVGPDDPPPQARLDDHRVWLQNFIDVVRWFDIAAVAIFTIVLVVTILTVMFTTRTGQSVF